MLLHRITVRASVDLVIDESKIFSPDEELTSILKRTIRDILWMSSYSSIRPLDGTSGTPPFLLGRLADDLPGSTGHVPSR